MSIVYSMAEASSISAFDADVFILAGSTDDRSMGMMRYLQNGENVVSTVLLCQYSAFDEEPIRSAFPEAEIISISTSGNVYSFLEKLKEHARVFEKPRILIDITSIRIPELFMLFKYIWHLPKHPLLDVAYSTPFDYEFQAEPFTSYHSYHGNLQTTDLPGFGGMSCDMSHSQMVIFLGFEGILSKKVQEDILYEKLVLVNNLPSFHEKYKDISIINNYDILASRHEKMAYVPAHNPFETYNFLEHQLAEQETACVAPLSTKPVALGVCLYALSHTSMRVVYPVAEEYIHHSANSVYSTYVYSIPLAQLGTTDS